MTRFAPGLLLAIALYVGLRVLVLGTAFEDVVMPMFELYPMGTMAELKLRGVHFPLRYYYDNAAGQLVLGHLTIPFYALFGSSYMVLKLVPATLGLGTLVLVWCFLDRHFSRVAANVAAVALALAPSTLVRYSVVCSGNHFENLFFTTLFLWAFYRHHARPTRASLFWAAFTAGFAIFVFLGAIVPVGICLGMHVGLRGARRILGDVLLGGAGFALGVLPLVVVNAVTSGRGLGFLSAKFAEGGAVAKSSTFLDRAGDFLGAGLVESGMFEPVAGLTTTQWGAVFVLAFAVAWLASLPGAVPAVGALVRGAFGPGLAAREPETAFERVKLVPFVLYLPLAAVAFGISDLRIRGYVPPMVAGGYRYYLPTLLFAICLVAIWCGRAWERRGLLRAGGVVLGGALIACGATSAAIVDWSFDRVGNGWRYDGYNFAQMARGFVSAKNALPKEEVVLRVGWLPEEVQDRVIRAIGFNLGVGVIRDHRRREGAAWEFPIAEVLAGFPASWHATLANGAGTSLRYLTRMEARTGDLPDLLRRVRPPEGPLTEEVDAGSATTNMALPFGLEVIDVYSENVELVQMEIPHLAAFERGFGLYCGRLARRGVPSEVSMIESFKQGFGKPAFLAGYESGLAGREH